MRTKERYASREEGFTIVELMMVLLVIGILVGIAVASYSFSVSTSKETACRANLRVVREGIAAYYAKNGRNPATLYELVPDYIDRGFTFRCPYSLEEYSYDPASGSVSCPYHANL
ncbi:MAG: prepilin-type N-terminal cleavage/methylation domain-containing protein [Actinobacteria bacterium]|nr:prepilin-type N-terminal cleavage/methylation domain-containing protein [Actinomycetota bacterium]